MAILKTRYLLLDDEAAAVDEIMDGMFEIFKRHGVRFAGDDRCATVEEALSIAVVDSRQPVTLEHAYTVNSDANVLEGWTSTELAEALREPLAALGVMVEHKPGESGASLDTIPDHMREQVKRIVEQVVEG